MYCGRCWAVASAPNDSSSYAPRQWRGEGVFTESKQSSDEAMLRRLTATSRKAQTRDDAGSGLCVAALASALQLGEC